MVPGGKGRMRGGVWRRDSKATVESTVDTDEAALRASKLETESVETSESNLDARSFHELSPDPPVFP